jgi:hypothetical protein
LRVQTLEGLRLVDADGWLYPSANSPAGCCFGEGWSGFETWGVWGLGHKHEMMFWLSDSHELKNGIEVEMELWAVFTNSISTARVECFVGGVNVLDHTITAQDFSVHFFIPPELIDFSKLYVSAIFHFERPIRPLDHCEGSIDDRELGVGVKRLRYKYNPELKQ